MAFLKDPSLYSAADWSTSADPIQFQTPFSSNDLHFNSQCLPFLESETIGNAPTRDPREDTQPKSPVRFMDDPYNFNTSGGVRKDCYQMRATAYSCLLATCVLHISLTYIGNPGYVQMR